jgi:Leucine-rich repeat (LRR) protein
MHLSEDGPSQHSLSYRPQSLDSFISLQIKAFYHVERHSMGLSQSVLTMLDTHVPTAFSTFEIHR